jgi:regulator of sirC expression with transglutaminase-like and TPR domain
VESANFPAPRREALISLFDDPSPVVRRAVLAELRSLGEAGHAFLRSLTESSNRAVGWQAARLLDELNLSDPAGEFRLFIRSLNYELETGSLMLSRVVLPHVNPGESCAALDGIARRCRELILEPMTARDKCRILNRVLFHELGYRGNTEDYTDPLNSFLPSVIERRKGIPISLSILYVLVAERFGLHLETVGVPGHFMVGCYSEDESFFIDPYERGVFRTAQNVYQMLRQNGIVPKATDIAPTPVREVLSRCCRNLAHHFNVKGEPERGRLFASFVEEFEHAAEQHLQP